jgi:hypothetical protein
MLWIRRKLKLSRRLLLLLGVMLALLLSISLILILEFLVLLLNPTLPFVLMLMINLTLTLTLKCITLFENETFRSTQTLARIYIPRSLLPPNQSNVNIVIPSHELDDSITVDAHVNLVFRNKYHIKQVTNPLTCMIRHTIPYSVSYPTSPH